MSITSNTGPLIALAKVDLLSVLKITFSDVLIPPSVRRELLAKPGGDSERLQAAIGEYIKETELTGSPRRAAPAMARLGAGEQEAIALAAQTGTPLLIDDRLARTAARELGVRVIGTAGLLVESKLAGKIPAVRPILEEIRRRGYHLSDALIDGASRLAGE